MQKDGEAKVKANNANERKRKRDKLEEERHALDYSNNQHLFVLSFIKLTFYILGIHESVFRLIPFAISLRSLSISVPKVGPTKLASKLD